MITTMVGVLIAAVVGPTITLLLVRLNMRSIIEEEARRVIEMAARNPATRELTVQDFAGYLRRHERKSR